MSEATQTTDEKETVADEEESDVKKETPMFKRLKELEKLFKDTQDMMQQLSAMVESYEEKMVAQDSRIGKAVDEIGAFRKQLFSESADMIRRRLKRVEDSMIRFMRGEFSTVQMKGSQ